MKGHMIDDFRRRFTFKKRNGHVVVTNGYAVIEIELFFQAENAAKPLRAFPGIANGQAKVADHPKCEWNLHRNSPMRVRQCGSEPLREINGSMKCRLKSSNAAHGVCPSPELPSRSSGPMKASQSSPAMPIFGRNRAAGLVGWASR